MTSPNDPALRPVCHIYGSSALLRWLGTFLSYFFYFIFLFSFIFQVQASKAAFPADIPFVGVVENSHDFSP